MKIELLSETATFALQPPCPTIAVNFRYGHHISISFFSISEIDATELCRSQLICFFSIISEPLVCCLERFVSELEINAITKLVRIIKLLI